MTLARPLGGAQSLAPSPDLRHVGPRLSQGPESCPALYPESCLTVVGFLVQRCAHSVCVCVCVCVCTCVGVFKTRGLHWRKHPFGPALTLPYSSTPLPAALMGIQAVGKWP